MFEKSVLKTFLFFGLMVVSLGACSGSSDDERFSGKGEIVDRKRYLEAYASCSSKVAAGKGGKLAGAEDGRLVMACVTDIFNKEVDDYCAGKEMSPAHEKCARLHGRVAIDLMMNTAKSIEEIKDAANSRSK
jgi:hypothetical protein